MDIISQSVGISLVFHGGRVNASSRLWLTSANDSTLYYYVFTTRPCVRIAVLYIRFFLKLTLSNCIFKNRSNSAYHFESQFTCSGAFCVSWSSGTVVSSFRPIFQRRAYCSCRRKKNISTEYPYLFVSLDPNPDYLLFWFIFVNDVLSVR